MKKIALIFTLMFMLSCKPTSQNSSDSNPTGFWSWITGKKEKKMNEACFEYKRDGELNTGNCFKACDAVYPPTASKFTTLEANDSCQSRCKSKPPQWPDCLQEI